MYDELDRALEESKEVLQTELTIKIIESYKFPTEKFNENGIDIYRYTLPNGVLLERIAAIDGVEVDSVCLDGFNDNLYIIYVAHLEDIMQQPFEDVRARYEDEPIGLAGWYKLYPE
jgi:hypothetical protein